MATAPTRSKGRLSKQDWLDHGLNTLASEGFTGLKADRMVKTLGVSRGSFYHHFEDLGAFHQSVLERWLEVTVVAVVSDLEAQKFDDPVAQLVALIEIASQGMGSELERAIRAWGFSDPEVRDTIAVVDEQRIAYVAHLLKQAGLTSQEARGRALSIYMSSVGYAYLGERLSDADRRDALAEISSYAKS